MANATTFNRILSKGIESELPKVVDGRLRFTTDTGRLFLDNGNERVEISDFVKGQTSCTTSKILPCIRYKRFVFLCRWTMEYCKSSQC